MSETAKKIFGIRFGAGADSIGSQLRQQGIKHDKKEAERFQRMADSIIVLRLNGLLADAAAEKCRKKLFSLITKHISK